MRPTKIITIILKNQYYNLFKIMKEIYVCISFNQVNKTITPQWSFDTREEAEDYCTEMNSNESLEEHSFFYIKIPFGKWEYKKI